MHWASRLQLRLEGRARLVRQAEVHFLPTLQHSMCPLRMTKAKWIWVSYIIIVDRCARKRRKGGLEDGKFVAALSDSWAVPNSPNGGCECQRIDDNICPFFYYKLTMGQDHQWILVLVNIHTFSSMMGTLKWMYNHVIFYTSSPIAVWCSYHSIAAAQPPEILGSAILKLLATG